MTYVPNRQPPPNALSSTYIPNRPTPPQPSQHPAVGDSQFATAPNNNMNIPNSQPPNFQPPVNSQPTQAGRGTGRPPVMPPGRPLVGPSSGSPQAGGVSGPGIVTPHPTVAHTNPPAPIGSQGLASSVPHLGPRPANGTLLFLFLSSSFSLAFFLMKYVHR